MYIVQWRAFQGSKVLMGPVNDRLEPRGLERGLPEGLKGGLVRRHTQGPQYARLLGPASHPLRDK